MASQTRYTHIGIDNSLNIGTIISLCRCAALAKKAKISARVIDDYSESASGQEQPQVNYTGFETLYTWYEKMPELYGVVSTVVSDIWGEGYDIDGSEARVKKVKNFLRNNAYVRSMKAVTRDFLVTGNGYLGKSTISDAQLQAAINIAYGNVFQKSASEDTVWKLSKQLKDSRPDLFSPQVLFPLLSKNIKIDYDENGIVNGYIQTVKSSEVLFAPEEVMHFAHTPIGDQIYGISPLQVCVYDIASLWYAKTYGGAFFQNDATPSYIFKLLNEAPESANYKRFVEELRKHKANPHKSMVVTGDIEIERVNPLNKDMEFSTFIDKFTQKIFLAFGMSARYSHLFGRPEIPANLEGYYKIINNYQADFEEQLNAELFQAFDVEFYFNRVYKRDESREADIVSKLTNLCLTVNEAREYLGYKPLPEPSLDQIQGRIPSTGKSEVESGDARSEQSVNKPKYRGQAGGNEDVE